MRVIRNFYVGWSIKVNTRWPICYYARLMDLDLASLFAITLWFWNLFRKTIEGKVLKMVIWAQENCLLKALGVQWNIDDTFDFKIAAGEKPLTCFGLLSTLSSVYNPLGLTASFILKGIIIQKLCKENSAWDEPTYSLIDITSSYKKFA